MTIPIFMDTCWVLVHKYVYRIVAHVSQTITIYIFFSIVILTCRGCRRFVQHLVHFCRIMNDTIINDSPSSSWHLNHLIIVYSDMIMIMTVWIRTPEWYDNHSTMRLAVATSIESWKAKWSSWWPRVRLQSSICMSYTSIWISAIICYSPDWFKMVQNIVCPKNAHDKHLWFPGFELLIHDLG